MKLAIKSETHEVNHALNDLNLDINDLMYAVGEGHLQYVSCTANDAPTYPGTTGLYRALRALRDRVISKGWEKSDKNNHPKVYNPKTKVAILLSSGDSDTGKIGGKPKTKNPKGSKTANIVENNVSQPLLFSLEQLPHEVDFDNVSKDSEYVTWVLLIHFTDKQAQCELSLPIDMDDSKRINLWKERIILPTTEAGKVESKEKIINEFAKAPEIEIKRKS